MPNSLHTHTRSTAKHRLGGALVLLKGGGRSEAVRVGYFTLTRAADCQAGVMAEHGETNTRDTRETEERSEREQLSDSHSVLMLLKLKETNER